MVGQPAEPDQVVALVQSYAVFPAQPLAGNDLGLEFTLHTCIHVASVRRARPGLTGPRASAVFISLFTSLRAD
ncbi:hypothetical protein GCM10010532_076330 [Dactylosporangium siamense]|uniref:Uncharacterized protein n=1 Tax=Dactylosporangium siamense TaxID=685454 RepID=A0A919PSR6_9ACTN|nr:hypothetical protein Dsi01nite_058060 [Dactylosporangium siamense]